MIIDGFDYGKDFTKATVFDSTLEWWDESDKTWNQTFCKDQSQMGRQVAMGIKYRRPMTEAEKQAEKAKEEKVTDKLIEVSMPVHYRPGDPTCTAFLPISEVSRLAQLPEVVAEVERQRKEREIKVGDWVFDKKYERYFKAEAIDGEIIYGIQSINGRQMAMAKDCKKQTDPSFIAMLEKGAK